jgi:hypothetical protein
VIFRVRTVISYQFHAKVFARKNNAAKSVIIGINLSLRKNLNKPRFLAFALYDNQVRFSSWVDSQTEKAQFITVISITKFPRSKKSTIDSAPNVCKHSYQFAAKVFPEQKQRREISYH